MELTFSCKDFGHYDLAVAGGGCTGVFAAVRAARAGLKVALIEKSNCFGGVSTNGLVNVWHSLFDTEGREQIIFGLTDEVEKTLLRGGYATAENTKSAGIRFDPNAMKAVLDELVRQNGVTPFFHTFYSALTVRDGKIENILVSNKDGLGTITADFFIDATGDGDLCRDAGLRCYLSEAIQPPSPACFVNGDLKSRIAELITAHGAEFGLENDWGWGGVIPGLDGIQFRADFHILGKLCHRAADLTPAELEGRKKIYALDALMKKYGDPKISVVALCSQLGIRETVHYETCFRATERALLLGENYDTTVMRGTYRVDIHHRQGNGITFKYLDGKTETVYGREKRKVIGNWREEAGITAPPARYYQIPFEILVQEKIRNLIPVGRMLHADVGAFGALRVMVNLNQLGEAAGVAAALCLRQNKSIAELDGKTVQKELFSK